MCVAIATQSEVDPVEFQKFVRKPSSMYQLSSFIEIFDDASAKWHDGVYVDNISGTPASLLSDRALMTREEHWISEQLELYVMNFQRSNPLGLAQTIYMGDLVRASRQDRTFRSVLVSIAGAWDKTKSVMEGFSCDNETVTDFGNEVADVQFDIVNCYFDGVIGSFFEDPEDEYSFAEVGVAMGIDVGVAKIDNPSLCFTWTRFDCLFEHSGMSQDLITIMRRTIWSFFANLSVEESM